MWFSVIISLLEALSEVLKNTMNERAEQGTGPLPDEFAAKLAIDDVGIPPALNALQEGKRNRAVRLVREINGVLGR